MNLKILFTSCVLLAAGCTSPVEKKTIIPPPGIHDSTQITEEAVLQAVYSTYKFPAGFYQEDFQGGSPYYENTVSIHAINDRDPHWFELSTNNRDQAFAWSESSSVFSSYYRKLVSERETEKYFEFRRVWEEHPTDIILSRVHKANYLDRSMYDRFYRGDTLGIFRKSIIDTSSVRELIEYLWFIEYYNLGGQKGLCTYVLDAGSSIKYILFYTTVSYGDWGLSDQISVMRAAYAVSKQTGIITQTQNIVMNITGKSN